MCPEISIYRNQICMRNFWAILLGLIGFSLTVILLFFEDLFSSSPSLHLTDSELGRNKFFNYNPRFTILFFLFAVEVGIWFFLASPIVRKIVSIIKVNNISKIHVRWSIFLVTVPIGISWFLMDMTFYDNFYRIRDLEIVNFPLYNVRPKMVCINVPGYLFFSTSLLGVYVITYALHNLKLTDDDSIARYKELRDNLYFFLYTLAIVVSLATIVFGILRSTTLAYNPGDDQIFPAEFVAAYGLFYTFLIGIFFIPVKIQLNEIGTKVLAAQLPEMPSNPRKIGRWLKLRDTITAKLGINHGWKEAISTIAPVLAPLIGGLLPKILG